MNIIRKHKILITLIILSILIVLLGLTYYYENYYGYNKEISIFLEEIDTNKYSKDITKKYEDFLTAAQTEDPTGAFNSLVEEVSSQISLIEEEKGRLSKYTSHKITEDNKNIIAKENEELAEYEVQLKTIDDFLKNIEDIPERDYPGYYVLAQKMINDYYDLDYGVNFTYNNERVKVAFLTFDDGPSRNTGDILNILKANGIKGTFFAVGTQIEEYPKEAQKIIDSGNTLANHSYTHETSEITEGDNIVKEAQETEELINNEFDYDTKLIRVPTGSILLNESQLNSLREAGYHIIDWSVDSRDWSARNVNTIYKNIKEQVDSSVEVILFHEKNVTLNALQNVIDYLQRQNYYLLPIPQHYTGSFEF